MQINMKFLGSIEIDEKAIINFEKGLPGFLELRKFALLAMEENPSLHYLQSLEDAKVCFIVMSPFLILESYEANVSEETVRQLSIESAEDVSLFVILTIPEEVKDITANITAPIVINNANNQACQEVLNDDRYSVKYKLFREE